jgi:hypothetical protein
MLRRALPAVFAFALLSPPKLLQASLHVSEPNTEQFPSISLLVSPTDEAGRRIPNLGAEDFQVLEDQQVAADLTAEEVLIGTRQVFVLNTSPGLGVRDSHGRTRYESARDALLRYWRGIDAGVVGVDDLSLLTADGLLIQHSRSAAELASALAQLEPDFEGGISGFDLLLLALDFSSDPVVPTTVPRSLVFITPVIETPRDLPLANAIARASESSTSVYPVLLASEESLEEPEVQPLRDLADATGGRFIVYEPQSGFDELSGLVLDQRYQYRLAFSSQAKTAGTHTIQVVAEVDGISQSSIPITYEIDVQPPQIAFIQPPALVTRQTDDPDLELQSIPPQSVRLELLLTFPDGYPRDIVHSELRVDGEVVAERSEPPFNEFTWDLSEIAQSETHTISAFMEDSLGLEAQTIDVPIQIDISRPAQGISAFRPAFDSLLAVVAVIVAGMVMVLGVSSLIRRAPRAESTTGNGTTRLNPVKRARLRSTAHSEAHLVPLRPVGDPIALTGVDVVFGRDASLAAIVLDDPSVERMHARLVRQADGEYLLRDQGSVAGTWVNYELLQSQGRRLQHGDLIQLGRVEFRFQLPGDRAPREIRVYPDATRLKE